MVTELTADNFRSAVENNAVLIIDFWAPWCAPCRGFAPIFEQTAQDNPAIAFAKVNTEEQQDLAGYFNIRSIPTLMVFREQVLLFLQPGSLPRSALDQLITDVMALDMDAVRREIAEQDANAADKPPA